MRHPRPHVKTLLSILTLSASVGFTSTHAIAQQHNHNHDHDHSAGHGQEVAANNPAAQRKAAIEATESFLSAHKAWAQSRGATNKANALDNLITKAEARREMMAELIKNNPAEALRVAIPEEKQVGMPEEVLAKLEQRLVVEGEFEAIITDYEDGSNKLQHIIKAANGERFELHMSAKGRELITGSQVNVYGLFLSGENEADGTSGNIAVSENPDDILTLAADGGATGGSNGGMPALPNTMGEQKVLVMMVNFQDDKSQPWSKAQVQSSFATVDDFIRENSYQQTSLTVNVTGWHTIPHSSSTCDRYGMVDDARAAAAASGINVDAYNRHVLIFPRNTSCSYQGLGTVGGNPSITWLNGTSYWFTAAHELGHNLGLYHSHDLKCNGSSIGDNCSTTEYGDYPDIMGSGKQGHFNAFQKDRLGWFGNRIQTVTSDGTYQIAGIEEDSNLPLALKVFKGTDPNNGLDFWYYLESRKATGFDSWLSTSVTSFDKGVGIRMGSPAYGNSSYLLDMRPQTSDFLDAALEPGQSFVDSTADVDIQTESVNNGVATVSILTGSPQTSCTAAQPSLQVSPGQSQWVAAGTTVDYSITVTNNDSADCAASSFSLNGSIPAGWSKSLSNNSLFLSPGQSASATLSVTSATSAANGMYDVTVTTASASYNASQTVTYVVDTQTNVNTAPNAGNDFATTESGIAVTIPVLNNDSDPDGDSLNVTSLSGVNGTASINNNGSITYTPAASFSGTEVFNYTISDGNGGSATATVSVTVNAPANNNNAPVAVNDFATTESGITVIIPVLNNDSDPDGDTLSVTSFSGVNGTASINGDGSISYTPDASFSGTEVFNYTVSDGNGGSATATVSVTVNAPTSSNSAPVAVDDSASMPGMSAITISVLNNDWDPENDNITLENVTQGNKGSVTINAGGTLTYTPGNRFKNTDTFTYTISDGEKTATATVSVQLQKSGGGSNGKGNGKKR